MIIVTKQQAKLTGLKKYFTGLPCKNGHISERTVASSNCVDCAAIHVRSKEYKQKAKEKIKTVAQKEKRKIQSKEYHLKNREQCLIKMKERNGTYYQKNSEKIKYQNIKYQKENAKERTAYKKKWAKEKAKNNPEFKMGLVCRRMLQRALGLSGQKKYKRTFDYLKYSSDDLVNHLESQFKDGMNWENYGEWHIDHIMPISYLIKNKIIDPAIINALTNLQPLWASENMSKGCKTNLITGI
jgi:hypothetical protein